LFPFLLQKSRKSLAPSDATVSLFEASVASLGDGIYITGGQGRAGYLRTTNVYFDPVTLTLTPKAALPIQKQRHVIELLLTESINPLPLKGVNTRLVIGGSVTGSKNGASNQLWMIE